MFEPYDIRNIESWQDLFLSDVLANNLNKLYLHTRGLFIGGWDGDNHYSSHSNWEVVFRVCVVRDVRAKLCAMLPGT